MSEKPSEPVRQLVDRAYTANDLRTMRGLAAVREKPGMYLGGTDERALHQCVNELLDNSVDEFLAGRCTRVEVVLHEDGSVSVADNGPGIPVEDAENGERPLIEVKLTILHIGPKCTDPAYQYSGGTAAVGAKCVNALSEWFRAETRRDGNVYSIEFERGETTRKLRRLRKLRPGEETGTRLTFKPDPLIFQTTSFDSDRIRARIREIAFCHPALELGLLDERSGGEMERIAVAFPELPVPGKRSQPPTELITITGEEERIRVRIVMRYVTSTDGGVVSFVNTHRTPEGGTHVSGLIDAAARALTTVARRAGLLSGRGAKVRKRDALRGIAAAVGILHPEPRFEGATKSKLASPDAAGVARRITYRAMMEYFEKHPQVAAQILARCLESRC